MGVFEYPTGSHNLEIAHPPPHHDSSNTWFGQQMQKGPKRAVVVITTYIVQISRNSACTYACLYA